MVPLVLDWSVEKENTSVKEIYKANTVDYELENVPAFRCKCNTGYEGNPYVGCDGTISNFFLVSHFRSFHKTEVFSV